jgi:hypothetical protein
MRKLSPERRRVAAICGACAAIIPSTTLLMRQMHSNSADFMGGLIVGVAIVLSIANVSRLRRSCS